MNGAIVNDLEWSLTQISKACLIWDVELSQKWYDIDTRLLQNEVMLWLIELCRKKEKPLKRTFRWPAYSPGVTSQNDYDFSLW